MVVPAGTPKTPLVPLLVMETPFKRVTMDFSGPLAKGAVGYCYILVVMDYVTRFPEAALLQSATARSIAAELLKIFAWVDLPSEFLTNQGTSFSSRLLHEVCSFLGIWNLQTSIYHPQTDGLIERFNRTLKGMLCKFPL